MPDTPLQHLLPATVESVRATVSPQSFEKGQHLYFTEHDNLVVCLEGLYGLWIPTGRGADRIELHAGDMLLRAAGTWIGLDPTADYQSLGFVFTDRMTIAYDTRPIWRDGVVGRVERFNHPHRLHLPHTLSRAGRLTCEAIKAGADQPPVDLTLRHLGAALLSEVAEVLRHGEAETSQPGKADHTFDAVCEYIREHCHQPLDRDTVAQAMRITPRHVSRLFADCGRQRFGDFLRNVRLERAAKLLTDPTLGVAEVGYRCGFSSPALFSRNFKQRFGKTPGRWRREFEAVGSSSAP